MGGVAIQLDPGLPPHQRSAPIGADDQAAGGPLRGPGVMVLDRGGWAERDLHVGHAAAHRRAGLRGLLDEQLAEGRMADAERTRNVRHHGGEIELRELAQLGGHLLFAGAMARQVMAAARAYGVVQAEALQLDDAPRRDPLAAHVIAIDGGLLQHQHVEPRPRQVGGQRPAADPAAHDHDIGLRHARLTSVTGLW